MKTLFDETVINGMTLRNRLVRSATWEGMCDGNGHATARLAACYSELARGGVGLIISGYAYVQPEGKQFPGQLAICDDSGAAAMAQVCEVVHREGGALCIQLVHTGGQSSSRAIGRAPQAPSAVKIAQYGEEPQEMTVAEIGDTVRAFAAAAARAKAWGCDAVQLHAAHGYLISQFLSPLANRRSDGYGGDIAGRSRFLREICRAVREAVGDGYPVLVKLNGTDHLEGGLDAEDALNVARLLDEEGIDAIEVSAGTPASGSGVPVRQGIAGRDQEAYNLSLAARVKLAVDCPVMVVGGLRSYDITDGIIRREEADYAAMSRPFIREPDLPLRWEKGDEGPARCISCNGCFKPGLKEGGIYCVVEKIERESGIVPL